MEYKRAAVLVTGASRGLGAATVAGFLAAGWHVAAVARDIASVATLVDAHPGRVLAIAEDLADPAAADRIVNTVRAAWPQLDALVNNAGIQGHMGPLWTSDDREWQRILRINLLAPVALCRAIVPWMQASGGGSIVNISGGGATAPRGCFAPYAASKAALVRVTETLAEECSGTGVRVNAVAPGAINTAMLDEVLAAGPEKVGAKEYLAAQRRKEQGGDDRDRAAACIRWLAGAESAPITGRLISAVWDHWEKLDERSAELAGTDIYTLRRISAKDRGKAWDRT